MKYKLYTKSHNEALLKEIIKGEIIKGGGMYASYYSLWWNGYSSERRD